MSFNPGIITQARTGSTRLPGKIFLKAGNKILLDHHIDRLAWSGIDITIATTENREDDEIFIYCKKKELNCYRGDEQNVLKRFYETAAWFEMDPVIRVTSDCPLIDGHLIRKGVEQYLESGGEAYVSNVVERTFPRGLDFEVFSFRALEAAMKNAAGSQEREHVTPYIRKHARNLIHIRHAEDASRFRLTVDEKADFDLIEKLVVGYQADLMSAEELIHLMKEHPELDRINAHIRQKEA